MWEWFDIIPREPITRRDRQDPDTVQIPRDPTNETEGQEEE